MIGLAFLAIALALVAGYFWLQVKSLRHWRGVFFALAVAPLVIWALWLIKLLRDTAADPTAHNLFPFEIAFIAIGSFAFLAVIAGIRQVVGSVPRN